MWGYSSSSLSANIELLHRIWRRARADQHQTYDSVLKYFQTQHYIPTRSRGQSGCWGTPETPNCPERHRKGSRDEPRARRLELFLLTLAASAVLGPECVKTPAGLSGGFPSTAAGRSARRGPSASAVGGDKRGGGCRRRSVSARGHRPAARKADVEMNTMYSSLLKKKHVLKKKKNHIFIQLFIIFRKFHIHKCK